MADMNNPFITESGGFTAEQATAEAGHHAMLAGLHQMPGFNFGHFLKHTAEKAAKFAVDNAGEIADVGADLAGEVVGGVVG